MDLVGAIIAGLVGTAVMTALMMTAPSMGLPKMDIIGLLGSMVSEDEGQARLIGTVMHFAMGSIFAIVYALLWSSGIGAVSWLWGIIFGLVHGVIVAVVMPMMLNMHPRPPQLEGGAGMLMGMLAGHVLFGLVVALVYGAFV